MDGNCFYSPQTPQNLAMPPLMGTKFLVFVMEALTIFYEVKTQCLYEGKLMFLR